MKRKHTLFSIFCLVIAVTSSPCLAQKKYEREFRIKPGAVPTRALAFIESTFKNVKVHWYGEESLTGKSIEAKLKDAGKHYSIEFDESGKIQDVEMLTKVSLIEEKARETLKNNLNKKFSRYKVLKTQLHWAGSEADLKQAILKNAPSKDIEVKYELVLRASKDKVTAYFEVQSQNNGALISVSEIVQRNADNLIY